MPERTRGATGGVAAVVLVAVYLLLLYCTVAFGFLGP